MESFFNLQKNKTSVKTEILAGLTTFLAMAYILAVNPSILSQTGMDSRALFTSTALAAAIATIIMAFVARLPFALAPGMGTNAFFAFGIVLGMGHTWQFALTAVLIEGLIFLILTFFNIREAIINSIPNNMKKAISVGIGLFIAIIGLHAADIIITHPATLVTLGEVASGQALLALIGLIIIGTLLTLKMKGAFLIGILLTTVIGIPMGITNLEGFKLISMPSSIAPIFFQFEFSHIFTFDMLLAAFALLFVDMFDTLGTLMGVATKAKMVDEDGKIINVKQAMFSDAIGTVLGSFLGVSTTTTYIESAAGTEEGGRTGLTALTVGVLFLLALFFSKVFLIIPAAATAPALILVGCLMITPIKEIDLEDPTEAIPAFLTIITMPLTFSIANGIMFGVLSYVVLKVLTGKYNEVSIVTYILSIFLFLKFIC